MEIRAATWGAGLLQKRSFLCLACPQRGLQAQQVPCREGAGGGCRDFSKGVDMFPSQPEEGSHPWQLSPV